VISGDRFTATANVGTNGEVTWTGRIKVDATRRPARFEVLDGRLEFAKTKGVMKAAGVEGVYELRGGSLKVCYGPQRPAQFKTKPGSSQKLYVFEREKPKGRKTVNPKTLLQLPPSQAILQRGPSSRSW
jgi:uncharacterized protein (TIGR03067 family)